VKRFSTKPFSGVSPVEGAIMANLIDELPQFNTNMYGPLVDI